MKKYLKIALSCLTVFTLLSGCNLAPSMGNDSQCGEAGVAVPTMAENCCDGLSEMWSTCAEDDCGCTYSFPVPGGLGICSDCGNEICERENNEKSLQLPERLRNFGSGTIKLRQ